MITLFTYYFNTLMVDTRPTHYFDYLHSFQSCNYKVMLGATTQTWSREEATAADHLYANCLPTMAYLVIRM